VWQPSNAQWWTLVAIALLGVLVWPPQGDRSLAVKFVNRVVDPRNELPVLPGPLPIGQEDDLDAVNLHDQHTRKYEELYAKGGWTRMRLVLKVARDPFEPGTERQMLALVGVVTALVVWRLAARRT
jgi:hypothetical protein